MKIKVKWLFAIVLTLIMIGLGYGQKGHSTAIHNSSAISTASLSMDAHIAFENKIIKTPPEGRGAQTIRIKTPWYWQLVTCVGSIFLIFYMLSYSFYKKMERIYRFIDWIIEVIQEKEIEVKFKKINLFKLFRRNEGFVSVQSSLLMITTEIFFKTENFRGPPEVVPIVYVTK